MIGRRLSHYEIVGEISRGGVGIVYRAVDVRLNREIALKVLAPELVTDPDRRRRFVQEARSASALEHPHIAVIHEIDEADGVTFIAMELVRGESLSDALRRTRPPPGRTLELAVEIAEGLARAHDKNIVHRDLKPANVIVTEEGHAKIIDFGLAKLIESAAPGAAETIEQTGTEAGAILGTVSYMSPEQASGGRVDHRSDIFSFGVLLYEMLTGQPPFQGRTGVDTLHAIINAPARPLPELGPGVLPEARREIERIVGKCLAKDAGDRYQGMRDVVVDLRAAAKSSGLQTAAPVSAMGAATAVSADLPATHPPTRIGRRASRGVWQAASAVVAIGVLGGAALLLFRESPTAPAAGSAPPRTALAVLPFQNLSADPVHAYFAGGLHEQLLTQLSKVSALSLRGRTSVMRYAGSTTSIRQIAEELEVRALVQGSVQVVGGRLRVNVQLLDAVTDEHLWAESYDRTLDDVFAIQSDVAQRVVVAVGAALSGTEQQELAASPTPNAEAYRFYLRGREYFTRGLGDPTIILAAQMFESAVALDPDFALAHAALAKAHARAHFQQYDASESRASNAARAAQDALRLNPKLPDAHEAWGWYNYWVKHDWAAARDAFTAALGHHASNSEVQLGFGLSQRRLGHWDEALEAFQHAQRIEPLSSEIPIEVGISFLAARRYPDAVGAFRRAVTLAPDHHRGYAYLAAALVAQDRALEGGIQVLRSGAATIGEAEFVNRQLDPNTNLEIRWLLPELFPNAFDRLSGVELGARAVAYHVTLAEWHWRNGRERDQRVHGAAALAIDPASPYALAHAGRVPAFSEAAKAWLAASPLDADWRMGPQNLHDVARLYAIVGNHEAALTHLERWSTVPSEGSVAMLQFDPVWKALRGDQRFQRIAGRQ